jgi:Sortase domain
MLGNNFYHQAILVPQKVTRLSAARLKSSARPELTLTTKRPSVAPMTSRQPPHVAIPNVASPNVASPNVASGSPHGTPVTVVASEPRSQTARGAAADKPNPSPILLVVPAANISVALDHLRINPQGHIDVSSDTESAGWWRKKQKRSPLVIAGHLDSKTGPAVFYHVQDLRFGDQIFLSFDDGSNASYTVRQVERVDKDKFPSQRIYNSGSGEVRLVTCGGKFNRHTGHYEDNIVVYATPDSL